MHANPYALKPGTLHLWTCAIDEADDAALAGRLGAILSSEERERSTRLRYAADRHRFIVSHAFVRLALSRHCAAEASRWRFDHSAETKPFVVAPDLPRMPTFSLSHTDGMAACLIGDCDQIGVDVEKIACHNDLRHIARSVLTDEELRNLDRYDRIDWTPRFFQLWTLKEAYAKACGVGIAMPLRDISFEIDGGAIRARFGAALWDDSSRWSFWSHAPSSEHMLSLAVPASNEIVVHRFEFEAAYRTAGGGQCR